jgi:DNA sulfur modification protein DndD
MSLEFRRITIRNFGPYYGTSSLDFAQAGEHPVTLVYGENTLGKTQMFSAIRWALYGTWNGIGGTQPSAADLDKRFNRKAYRAGEDEMSVTLEFTSNGKRYDLNRAAVGFASSSPRQQADLRIDSTAISASRIPAEVGSLLHPQIADFFLFDGELLERFFERLRTTDQRRAIRDSIDRVLGVPALQAAFNDISDMARAQGLAAAKSVKVGNERVKAEADLRKAADLARSIESDLVDLRSRLTQVSNDHDAKSEELRSVEALKEDAKQLEMLEARVADLKGDLKKGSEKLQDLLSEGWYAVAYRGVQSALVEARRNVDAAQARQETREGMSRRVRTLEAQLQGGHCETCRQALPPAGPEVHDELALIRAEMAALPAATNVRELVERERQLTLVLDARTARLYRDEVNGLNRARVALIETQRELDDINDRLAEHSAPKIRSLANQVEDLKRLQERAKDEIERRTESLLAAQAEQNKIASRLGRLPGVDPRPATLSAFYGYLSSAFEYSIQGYRESVRGSVERDVTDQFKRLIRDPGAYGEVRIGPDFDMHLLDPRGQERQTSEGGRQLLALAFIGALKRVAVRGGPVIIDSPLGRLDKEHRVHVLRDWVPYLGSQASLFVQSGELTANEAAEVIGSIIGAEYRLVRPDGDPEHVAIERMGGSL